MFLVVTICKSRTTLLLSVRHFHSVLARDVNGGALDTIEYLWLDTEKDPQMQNFETFDGLGRWYKDGNFWQHRLPWPLFDITTVKIPVSKYAFSPLPFIVSEMFFQSRFNGCRKNATIPTYVNEKLIRK